MGIDFKVNFKTKIKINGREYGSLEEVPQELRHTVEDALAKASPGSSGRITVNGVSYDGPDEMPPDVRRLYEEALAKAGDTARRTGMPAPQAQVGFTLKPEGALSPRVVTAIIAVAGLALLVKFLMSLK